MISIPVLCLMGPTACGKSDLAIALAQDWPLQLISVDSAMVYQGLDIGSSKPSVAVRAAVPHQLIDIRQPWQIYSVADFVEDAKQAIITAYHQQRIPCLVGGTLWYFYALQHGLSSMPGRDDRIRAWLCQRAAQFGWPMLHDWLAQSDAKTAARIHPNDSQRIQRALEILLLSGKQPASFYQQKSEQAKDSMEGYRMEWLSWSVCPSSRAWLHQRIAERFHTMLADGLIEEVALLKTHRQFSSDLPAMRAVGYRQVLAYLAGDYDQQDLLARGIAATRQLAKRQLTWLKRWPNNRILWVDQLSFDLQKQQLNQYMEAQFAQSKKPNALIFDHGDN